MKNALFRQEIEIKTGLTQDMIRKNEKHLGLLDCKVAINKRLIFYRRTPAIAALRKIGLWID